MQMTWPFLDSSVGEMSHHAEIWFRASQSTARTMTLFLTWTKLILDFRRKALHSVPSPSRGLRWSRLTATSFTSQVISAGQKHCNNGGKSTAVAMYSQAAKEGWNYPTATHPGLQRTTWKYPRRWHHCLVWQHHPSWENMPSASCESVESIFRSSLPSMDTIHTQHCGRKAQTSNTQPMLCVAALYRLYPILSEGMCSVSLHKSEYWICDLALVLVFLFNLMSFNVCYLNSPRPLLFTKLQCTGVQTAQ